MNDVNLNIIMPEFLFHFHNYSLEFPFLIDDPRTGGGGGG